MMRKDLIERDELVIDRRLPSTMLNGQIILFDQFTLFRRSWKWVLLIALVSTVGAFFYLKFYVPNVFLATVKALPPNKSGTPLDNIVGGVASTLKDFGLSRLVGKGNSEAGYSKTVLMTSRPVLDSLIARHDLYTVYEIPRDRSDLMYGALVDNILVDVQEDGPVLVSVYDTSPERAATMANDIIHFTNTLSRQLNTLESEPISQYVGERLDQARAKQQQLGAQLREFMARNKIFDPEGQAGVASSALMQAEANVASQRSLVEVYTKALGADDPRTVQAQEVLRQYEAQSRKMAAGRSGALESMSLSKVPSATVEYLRIRQDYETNAKVIALMEPIYEQTKYDQVRNIPILNVLEPALPPPVKAKPRRTLILASAFLGTFIISYLLIAITAYGKGFMRRYRVYSRNVTTVASEVVGGQEKPRHEIAR